MLTRLGVSPVIRVAVMRGGKVVREEHLSNIITHAGLALLRDALGTGHDIQIRQLALGDGDVPPSLDDLALGNERFRAGVTARSTLSSNQNITTVYVGANEANFSIREVGWFCTPSATSSADSGVLFARMLFELDKSPLESIQFDRRDIFNEVL